MLPGVREESGKNTGHLPTSLWVVSLYFIEGLPYSLVNTVSVALFKTMQVGNSQIGLFTSLFYIPWAIKFLWAPLIDCFGKRRTWIIVFQVVLAVLTFILSLCIFFSQSFIVLCLLFALIALSSATYDVACDGYYLDSLSTREQAFYVGWRNTAYKIAWLFAGGFLVYVAGRVASAEYSVHVSETGAINAHLQIASNNSGWCIAFLIAAAVFLLAAIFHNYKLADFAVSKTGEQGQLLSSKFKDAFISFFQQSKILLILLWILIFRAGDAMLLKMAQPFLLDAKTKGGLGLTLSEVGIVYGSLGMVCLLAGGIVGGWLVFKYGLKKCLFPTAILQSITLLLYWLLALMQPTLITVAFANGFEQFAYGLATAAYTTYLFTIVKEKFLASHYAIATGFMAIGMILPGAVSGFLVDWLGYQQFFIISFLSSLPGIFCTLKLPFSPDN